MGVAVKVDEDLPTDIAELLRAAGHDASTVHAQGHSGLPDDQLWSVVQREQRLLLTADKGFANAQSHPPGSHAGIVLLRLRRESRVGYVQLTTFLLSGVRLEDIAGAIVVVSPDVIRVLRA